MTSPAPRTASPAIFTVVGPGRIGSAFLRAFDRAGHQVLTVTRASAARLEHPLPGPILVTTRLKDLEPLLTPLHPANRDRLVLVQNGYLPPLLKHLGLEGVTVGVLYVAATDRVSEPRPGLPSVFYGPVAEEVADALSRGGIPARVAADQAEMCAEEATKLLWLCTVAALSAAHRQPVEAFAGELRPTLEALLDELLPVAARLYAVQLDRAQVLETLTRYSQAIAGYRGSGSELEERNLLLWRAGATGPVHRRLLETLGVSLPE